MSKQNAQVVLAVAAAAVAAAGAATIANKRAQPRIGAATTTHRLLDYLRDILPEHDSILGEPSEEWDWILGGRVGPNVWKYYQWAEGAKYGTTCGIFAAAALARANGPKECINRDPPEGSGYRARMHIAQLYEGAKKTANLQQYTDQTLLPGDIYCQMRDTIWQGKKMAMEHVGIVFTEEGKNGEIITVDGGQTAPTGRQCAKRVKRRRQGNILHAVDYGTQANLQWIIRIANSPQ